MPPRAMRFYLLYLLTIMTMISHRITALALLVAITKPNGGNPFTTHNLPSHRSTQSSPTSLFASIGIFYGTSTGSTEEAANLIKQEFGDAASEPIEIDEIKGSVAANFALYDSLIVGTPTWNTGADTERSGTGWDEIYYSEMKVSDSVFLLSILEALQLFDDDYLSLIIFILIIVAVICNKNLNIAGKKVAVFGLGDSVSYSENYADATGELHDVFASLGCKMIGYTSQEGHQHKTSKSICGDEFCGLLLDAVNEEELTEDRVKNWVAKLLDEGILESSGSSAPSSTVVAVSASPSPQIGISATAAFEDLALAEEILAEVKKTRSGYMAHYNPRTDKTMWISTDGRSSYVTAGVPGYE